VTEPGKQVQKWSDEAMYTAAPMELDRDEHGNILPRVRLLWMTPDPLGAIAAFCRMYEGKVTPSLTDITDDERRRYLEQVQKTHLQAPLEAVKLHFFIEGVTRSFTHQMVRQRTAVYAQESLRFAVKEEPFVDITSTPPSLAATRHIPQEKLSGYLPADTQEQRNRDVWDACLEHIDEAYHYLVSNGMPAEDARGLIHHAITTRLNYATDLRNLKEHAGNRLCTQAQFEWRLVFMGIVKSIREYQPSFKDGPDTWMPTSDSWQFEALADSDLFRPICYQLGRCQFEADFDRYCSIRDRVTFFAAGGIPSAQWGEAEAWDSQHIDVREWLVDPNAARNTSGDAGH
jgi:flavin-dependent thymidylate synthase